MGKPYYKKMRKFIPTTPKVSRKPKSKFWAIHNVSGEKFEGILYDDGTCMLGPDAFRSLDKSDFPSYETKDFSSLAKVKELYTLKKPTYTAWYMEYKETTNNRS